MGYEVTFPHPCGERVVSHEDGISDNAQHLRARVAEAAGHNFSDIALTISRNLCMQQLHSGVATCRYGPDGSSIPSLTEKHALVAYVDAL